MRGTKKIRRIVRLFGRFGRVIFLLMILLTQSRVVLGFGVRSAI